MDIFLASLGIFIGELYGNLVGGGSIVTQFFLQTIIGMEIKNAIALDNAAVMGSEIALFLTLLRKNKIEKFYLVFLITIVIGSYLGVEILRLIPTEILKTAFSILLVVILIKILFSKNSQNHETGFDNSVKNLILLGAAGLFVGAYNAFMSIGDFIIGLLILINIFHFKYHKALFLLSFVLVFGRGLATYQYFSYSLIDFNFYVPMFASAALSGTIMGFIAHKIKTEYINVLLKMIGVCFAVSIIFNLLS